MVKWVWKRGRWVINTTLYGLRVGGGGVCFAGFVLGTHYSVNNLLVRGDNTLQVDVASSRTRSSSASLETLEEGLRWGGGDRHRDNGDQGDAV